MNQGVLSGMAAGALWGIVFMVPVWVPDFSPLQLSAGRYLAYGVFALFLLLPRWKTIVQKVSAKEWLILAWLSLTGNILYYVLLATAVQMGGAAMTSLVIGFLPVAVTLIGYVRQKNIALRRLIPSLVAGIAGLVCIAWPFIRGGFENVQTTSLSGLLCALGALASWSAFAVSNSTWLIRRPHYSGRDWSALLGLVTGVEALLLAIPALSDPTTHTNDAWLRYGIVSAGTALFASIIGNALWNRMCRLLPLTMTGQMILFETLFALLYCFLWEVRLPSLYEALAALFLIASVMSCVAVHRCQKRVPGQA